MREEAGRGVGPRTMDLVGLGMATRGSEGGGWDRGNGKDRAACGPFVTRWGWMVGRRRVGCRACLSLAWGYWLIGAGGSVVSRCLCFAFRQMFRVIVTVPPCRCRRYSACLLSSGTIYVYAPKWAVYMKGEVLGVQVTVIAQDAHKS